MRLGERPLVALLASARVTFIQTSFKTIQVARSGPSAAGGTGLNLNQAAPRQ